MRPGSTSPGHQFMHFLHLFHLLSFVSSSFCVQFRTPAPSAYEKPPTLFRAELAFACAFACSFSRGRPRVPERRGNEVTEPPPPAQLSGPFLTGGRVVGFKENRKMMRTWTPQAVVLGSMYQDEPLWGYPMFDISLGTLPTVRSGFYEILFQAQLPT